MNKLFFSYLFSFLFSVGANAQSEFKTISNKLFFNIFTGKPDSSVYEFVNKYAPQIFSYKKPWLSNGIWDHAKIDSIDSISSKWPILRHSLLFTHHPYFKENFEIGELEV